MNKYITILALANETQKYICTNATTWTSFLNTASNLYKYPFDEQLLIFAQRPDATACAEIEIWNEKQGCWVNKDAKGIALIDKESDSLKLKYVFDIKDVHRSSRGRYPYLWHMKEDHKNLIVDSLINRYGETNEKKFAEQIIDISKKIIEENFDSYLDALLSQKENSFLEELDDHSIEVTFKNLLQSSVSYTILKRCGVSDDRYFELLDFNGIYNFNTIETLSQLGNANAELSKPALMQIARTIFQFEKKQLENKAADIYNNRKEQNTFIEVENHEYNISKERRVSSTEYNSGKSGADNTRQIWENEKELHNGTQNRDVPKSSSIKPAEQSPGNNRESSTRDDGHINITVERERKDNGGVKRNQSSRMDSKDEQHNFNSGGNSKGGDYLQLSLFPTFEQQTDAIKIGAGNKAPFSFNKDSEKRIKYSYIDPKVEKTIPKDILTTLHQKLDNDVRTIFEEMIEPAEIIKELKKKYYHFGRSWPTETGLHGFNFGSKGLDLHWKDSEGEKTGSLTWLKLVKNLDNIYSVEQKPNGKKIKHELDTSDLQNAPKNKEENKIIENATENNDSTIIISNNNSNNFKINLLELGAGGQKDKFWNNVEAIKVLLAVEKDNRPATQEEKLQLIKYVGWGGLPNAFDEKAASWSNEYSSLKSLLNETEYISARETTLNAHYTPLLVIKEIYNTFERLGFVKGSILDPALGTGHFMGMLPASMQESSLYGCELDNITGRIAKLLYPDSKIEICGFENSSFKDNSFDIAVGNVPFGNYKVYDRSFKNNNMLIHDYFFCKTLEKVKPGGIISFISSKGTLDKKNIEARKYIGQRAEFLGAVRLPNNTFAANAGTEVTSDIIFLKKRDALVECNDDWLYIGKLNEDIFVNEYFINHPEMILGRMESVSTAYGRDTSCFPIEDANLSEQLKIALSKITGEIEHNHLIDSDAYVKTDTLPSDPTVNNYSFTVINDEIYYKEVSEMVHRDFNPESSDRIKKLIELRTYTRNLIDLQLNDYPDDNILAAQNQLSVAYKKFVDQHDLINSKINKKLFSEDTSYPLLCSLEVLNNDGSLKRKSDIFTKRTINQKSQVITVNTAHEALIMSLNYKARVDLDYMSGVMINNPSEEKIISALKGVIFKNPLTNAWETSDEYLSGNIREKYELAKKLSEIDNGLTENVEALKSALPKDLLPSEIDVRLGSTWIEPEIIKEFIRDTFKPPLYQVNIGNIDVLFSSFTSSWNIKGKSYDSQNIVTNVTFGTKRSNAYKILEDSLNLKDTRVYDQIEENGTKKSVLNQKETLLAQQKQDLIKEEFNNWIFKDPERRDKLCKKYNEKFNSTRPREYNGDHLIFPGMNTDISLRKHQKNSVARGLYGGNTLLAHVVGAGKTFAMIAMAMEGKRLGLNQKSLFVVPNHLIEQWQNDFITLYPGANILAVTKEDFEPSRRKKFCSRIATGDFDAVIIGHSQFTKIPLSPQRQAETIRDQIDEITLNLKELKENKGEKYSIKQLEKTKKSLGAKLEKLNDATLKDSVITFEELGVDRLFVDEAHSYKNLFLYTKMRNVAGISQTEAQKSSDMFAKCLYIDEITGGKGIVFATGTPISNSMTELYTMMRYLQISTLKKLRLEHFDSWASTFGETVTAMELAPEGTGYRMKTRFAKFFNIPELINIFKDVADIQTADMLDLPLPKAEYKNIVVDPSLDQEDMVLSLADRAELVRSKAVEPYVDNMLKITNDGRKLALDQRLCNPLLEDFENSKVNTCVSNVFDIWETTKKDKLTQLIFCDLSTPKKDNTFSIYDDIKKKLILKGVPEKEIEFIHNAKTDTKKAELFAKVRSGDVRILLGSSSKMGAGTNVQTKLVALHHLDVPWKPSDIEQEDGRILRQGNNNKLVFIFKYITKGTFDAYSWQLIENKQKFISQIMTSKAPVRSCEDIDEATLSFAEVKALAAGDPDIKEKMDLDVQVSRLKLMKANYLNQRYELEKNLMNSYPKQISMYKEKIELIKHDISVHYEKKRALGDNFLITINTQSYSDKKLAGEYLIEYCKALPPDKRNGEIGRYMGFSLSLNYDSFSNKFFITLKNSNSYSIELGTDPLGNITRINNCLESLPSRLQNTEDKLSNLLDQVENAKIELEKPFSREDELTHKIDRLSFLDAKLNDSTKTTTSNARKAIMDDLKKNNVVPSRKLVESIMSFSELMGKTQTIEKIKDLEQNNSIDENYRSHLNNIANLIKVQKSYDLSL